VLDTKWQQGTHTAASASITVAEAFQQWIAAGQANGLEHGSIRQRRQHLRCHVAPYLGGAKLAELTLPRVNKFLDTLRDNGRSTVMRRKVLTSVKSAISYAQGQGWCAQNVARAAKVARVA
jgi:integrase